MYNYKTVQFLRVLAGLQPDAEGFIRSGRSWSWLIQSGQRGDVWRGSFAIDLELWQTCRMKIVWDRRMKGLSQEIPATSCWRKNSGYQNFMEAVTSNTLNFSENRLKQGKKCNYHFGTLKKASKNVCMPSLFSWIINANPKRKKDRWRFLSWGHSVLHAETSYNN